jgi:large subunit ribosomal protein L16
MLQPKRSKHRKGQKGRIRETAKRGATIEFGSYALKSLEAIWLTNRQLEAARQALSRAMKREGNIWIRVFPDKPITKKPQEVRMGKGKGNPEYWAAVVEPGRILFEADGVSMAVAKEALELAAQKLPIKTKFIVRRDVAAELIEKK